MDLLIHWIVNSLAILIAAYLLPGVHVEGLMTALVVALVLGIVNTFLKPIFILLTLPITILTLGLFRFVINALLVLMTSNLVWGFSVDGFWWALLFSLVLSFVNTVLHAIFD